MIVFRLAKMKFCHDLSGRGAEMTGGRWNSKGTPMLYTGESRALCTAEAAVHIPLRSVPEDYMMIMIEIPDDAVIEPLLPEKLESDWNSFPYSHSTQLLGDDFIKRNQALALRVPSAVVQGDYNYLLNPLHADFTNLRILEVVPFGFDNRLFVR
jgi:RES domain-containing protein